MEYYLFGIYIIDNTVNFDRRDKPTVWKPLSEMTRSTQKRLNYLFDHYKVSGYISMLGKTVTTIRRPV